MKTRKPTILTLLALLVFTTTLTTMHAQVTIGSETAPQSYSLLELNTTSVKGGLRLPQLTTTQRNALGASGTAAKGLTIFNTTTNCFDVWNGTAWVSHCSDDSAPQITTQPRAFNWKETTATSGSMSGIGTSTSYIRVVATGIGTLTYQWYEVPANPNAQPVAVSDGSYGTSASFMPNLSTLGMRRYFCRVTDGNGRSVDSNIAEVAVGCGAKTVQGGWHTFMCYNLGATRTTIALQKSYTPTAETDNASYGDLYQWGRPTDGHEKRNSPTTTTLATNDIGTLPAAVIGRFILAPSSPYNWTTYDLKDLLWHNYRATNDPCPDGWRVPSQREWGSIFNGKSDAYSSSSTANTWTWYDGNTKGYEVKPDGVTTTLFLPAAGYRYHTNGVLSSVGILGGYWSNTIRSTFSL